MIIVKVKIRICIKQNNVFFLLEMQPHIKEMPKRRDSEESKGDEEKGRNEEYILEQQDVEGEGKQSHGEIEDGKEEKETGKHQIR